MPDTLLWTVLIFAVVTAQAVVVSDVPAFPSDPLLSYTPTDSDLSPLVKRQIVTTDAEAAAQVPSASPTPEASGNNSPANPASPADLPPTVGGPSSGEPQQPGQPRTATPSSTPSSSKVAETTSAPASPTSAANPTDSSRSRNSGANGKTGGSSKPSNTPTATATATSTSTPQSETNDTGQTASILGGVLGGLAALVGLLALFNRWKSGRDRRQRSSVPALDSKPPTNGGAGQNFASVPPGKKEPLTSLAGHSTLPENAAAPISRRNSVLTTHDQGQVEDAVPSYTSGYVALSPAPQPLPMRQTQEYQGGPPNVPPNGEVLREPYSPRYRPPDSRLQYPDVHQHQPRPGVGYGNGFPPMQPPQVLYASPKMVPAAGPYYMQQPHPSEMGGGSPYPMQPAGRMNPMYPGASPTTRLYSRNQQAW